MANANARRKANVQKITPFLWFNGNAEEIGDVSDLSA
jgi:hypothetical protein